MSYRAKGLFGTIALASVLVGVSSEHAAAQGGASAAPSCLARPNVRRMQIVDDENVLFVMRDKTTFRSALARACPGLRRDSQISLTAADRQVCVGGSFQVLLRVGTGSNSESVMVPGGTTVSVPRPNFVPGPTCILGAFTPMTDAEVDALVEASARERATSRRERRRGDAERGTEDVSSDGR